MSTALIPFFIVLFAGLFFSEIFHRFHFPWVIALILSGVIIGPHGLDLIEQNETIEFIGQIGLVFLMFMAGLETKFSHFRQLGGRLLLLSLFFGGLPFLAGFLTAKFFGYSAMAGVFLGIVFISSSISVIIPTLEQTGLIKYKLGKSVVSATIIVDVASLIFLAVLLQKIDPRTSIPLPIFYASVILVLFLLRWAILKIQKIFSGFGNRAEENLFQDDIRVVFSLLLATVVVFQFFGLHPILAGFFAGLVLSEVIKSKSMDKKLRAMGYGLFIPTFFIITGTKTDIGIFFDASGAGTLVLAVVLASTLSKFFGGVIGGRLAGFTLSESIFIGVSGTPQLSTTLAVAVTGTALGILDAQIFAALVFLSSLTAFVGPILMKILSPRHDASFEIKKDSEHIRKTLSSR